ncbi:MAG TPA: hypothetical protein VNA04_17580 [Thermoanaerobaculia bacterium]|nr:hypothetical protein [Thermoanaerobaculia bacterium]
MGAWIPPEESLKDLPVLQCDRCSRYSVADDTLQVEAIVARVDSNAELEIIRFAA